ncbi:hypothetical protein [Legionella norrlandica]|uniref:hypothetical protein n=1 Tax=Legionella norrlandica TaxID=1498499 RepID=UPI000A596764|nr:hypothetical protein [Legionella norrlandica]
MLVGALAPFSIYLSLFAFAFDVFNVSLRAYIELSRLYHLQEEYTEMLKTEENPEKRRAIREHQDYINHRIKFEILRSSLAIGGALAVLLAMSFAIPALALANPALPLIGAIFLMALWGVTFYLTKRLEKNKPVDDIEKPASEAIKKLGFFASKNDKKGKINIPEEQETECLDIELTTASFAFN